MKFQQISVDEGSHATITIIYTTQQKYGETAEVQELGEELMSLAERKKKRNLILSMQNTDFLSSSALNKLILLHKKCAEIGGQLRICNVHPDIFEVFTITRLSKYFNLDQDLETAVQNCNTPVPLESPA